MRSASSSSFLYFVILIFLMSSCRAPKDLEFREYKNLKLENLGFTNASLSMDLVYYNPNNFGLELGSTDFDIFIDSTLLGHSLQDIQVAIPKRDLFTIPLKVDLDMRNLLRNGITALLNKEVKVKLLGKIKVGKAGIYKTFNVNYETVQNFSMFK